MFRQGFLLAFISICMPSWSEVLTVEEVTIIGEPTDTDKLPGSGFVIGEQELTKFEYTDINRIVRQVPGVYLQEEDGFGLRPNIGMRGAGAERSEKIILMEDGIPIAPAPYAAPAAYYFPTAARMNGIEVLKGPTILRYGPSTVAGAINLISSQIPNETETQFNLETGNYGTNRAKASYGTSNSHFGWLFETHQLKSKGFKTIDNSKRDPGYAIEDYVFKGRIHTDAQAEVYHQFDLKFQYSEEASNETYVGLTDNDFKIAPNRRYGLTALDQMDNRHSSTSLRYLVKLNPVFNLNVVAYENKFQRDWFKVDKINGDKFSSIIDAANNGDFNALGILNGDIDASLSIKHNNRDYLSRGTQLLSNWSLTDHELQMGIRYHEDKVDRFQPSEIFQQRLNELRLEAITEPNASNNRVEEATALAVHIMDVWQVNTATAITLGLRYEDIETQQQRYADVSRRDSSITAENSVNQLLWSSGITYDINSQWQFLAGAHSGFAPASPSTQENVEPEESTNWEVGARFRSDDMSMSAIAFYSDYENRTTNCSLAFPCGAFTSGSVSEGESVTKGMEFTLRSNLYTSDAINIPLQLSYTYTSAEITSPAGSSNNQVGDKLPYVPQNVLNLQVGFEFQTNWSTYVNAYRIDDMCIQSGCNRLWIDRSYLSTERALVFDLTTQYTIDKSTQAYLKVDNLFNDQSIVSRSPGGARPGKPRSAKVGIKFLF